MVSYKRFKRLLIKRYTYVWDYNKSLTLSFYRVNIKRFKVLLINNVMYV